MKSMGARIVMGKRWLLSQLPSAGCTCHEQMDIVTKTAAQSTTKGWNKEGRGECLNVPAYLYMKPYLCPKTPAEENGPTVEGLLTRSQMVQQVKHGCDDKSVMKGEFTA